MRLPVSGQTLVAVTIIGAILSGGVAVALANPHLVGTDPLSTTAAPTHGASGVSATPAIDPSATEKPRRVASTARGANEQVVGAASDRQADEQAARLEATGPTPPPSTPTPAATVSPPTPNPNFTPAVQTRQAPTNGVTGERDDEDDDFGEGIDDDDGHEEHEEYHEHEDHRDEADEEGHDDD